MNPGAAAVSAEKSKDSADVAKLLDLLSGKYRTQALSTVASLGVPDVLARGPRTLGELAAELKCDGAILDRLLRFTVGLGFLNLEDPDLYSLTKPGEQLCSNALGPLATFVGSKEQWDPWARLRDSIVASDGASPFEATFGVDLYEYLATHPEAAARYDVAIDSFTQQEARELSSQFDFAEFATLVDVGGGKGTLLHEVVSAWPNLDGVLCDLPHVVENAKTCVPAELKNRITFEPGDFFESLPTGHDLYCLKHVLHNWDDERAVQLLNSCTGAMAENGRILVIEAILTPDNRFDHARIMDLEMGVLTPGRVRRKPEYRKMFRAAGLKLESVVPIGPSWLLVGSRLAEVR